MKTSSQNGLPLTRIRFVTRRTSSPEQCQQLSSARQVTFLSMDSIGERGELDVSVVRDIDDVRTGYTQFFEGDVVVAKITPCFENGKGALVSGTLNGIGYGTTELHVLSPGPKLDGHFLYYITVSEPFRKLGEAEMTGAAGQKRVPEDFVRDYKISLPPLCEQQAIVSYLNQGTARLDHLVAEKEGLLELITEKRRSLIANALTRGLDYQASLRDPGIPWLGRIPAHWEIKRAKWLFRERDERSTTGKEILLSLRMKRGLVPHNDVSERLTRSEELIGYKKVAKGEMVINRMRAASGLIALSPQDGLVSPDYAVFQCSPEVDQNYFTHLFKTELLQSVFRSESTGLGTGSSGFLRLYSENFLALWVPCPSLDEQRAIVAHIATETAKLDALRAATEQTIARLKERRSALIAAAVTGQLNIGEMT